MYEDKFEEFDMGRNGDEHNSEEGDSEPEPCPCQIEFKKNWKKNKRTWGGMLAILLHSLRDSSYEIPQVDLQLSLFMLSIFHLKFLTMADLKNCQLHQGPHGQ